MTEHNQIFRDINGQVPFSEGFRPVNSNDTLKDKQGSIWKRITGTGWVRDCDRFFWPFTPLADNTPSVEDIRIMRERMNGKNNSITLM